MCPGFENCGLGCRTEVKPRDTDFRVISHVTETIIQDCLVQENWKTGHWE